MLMAEPMPKLLVRYGEIGLKSTSVRRRFEQQLVADIRMRHALAKTPCVISQTRGRLFVDSDDWRKSCEILSRTFGVVSFSPVTQTTSDIDGLTTAVLDFSEPLMFKGASFAVRSRRSGNHSYTSQTLAEHLGEAILKRHAGLGIRVSLDEPDVELFVEVRDRDAYLFSSVIPGPGGMPLGTQGRMLSAVDSEYGIASTWLMMKRGCSTLVAVDDRTLIEPLKSWCPNLKTVDPERDLMALAQKNDCVGMALAWGLKDIERLGAPKGELPVFYPLVGMSKEEIEGLLARIRG
jgi:thiamine biosynthesis protein ThiI